MQGVVAVPRRVMNRKIHVRWVERRQTGSILPRIGQTRCQPETRDIHRPAGSGDQRSKARVGLLEIKNNTRPAIAALP
jgi:hypothetical protein